MEGIVTIIILIILLISCLIVGRRLHNGNIIRLNQCNKVILYDQIDEALLEKIGSYIDKANHYNFVYSNTEMPLGRASAFLNFFGKSIYDEEPYLFLCKRSSKDNEFREYGCLFARTGIYFSEEINVGAKTAAEGSKNKSISFCGLSQVFSIGNLFITINVRPDKYLDSIRIKSISDQQLLNKVKAVCEEVVAHNIGYFLYKGNVAELVEPEQEDDSTIDEYKVNDEDEGVEEYSPDTEIEKTEKALAGNGVQKGVQAAGVQAVMPKFAAFFGEIKHLMDGARGHGYAAEYANNTADRVLGREVESAAQVLDDHGRQVKHGADRLVNSVEIQTKYYKTANETIGAAFEKKQAIYIRSDGSGKMMQIEVPRDQYQDALTAMQKRIDSGQVPNVSPGESAKDYVRKGFFTYEQSFNIARAGTIESLSVDAAAGAVCCLGAASISSLIIFAQAMWRGETPKQAMKECLQTSLVIMGKGTLIYTLTMQLSRKEVANVLAGKVLTADGISQGYVAFSNPIYSLSENMASKISSSAIAGTGVGQKLGLDKMTGRRLIGGSVTIVVVFGPDLVRSLQGKISMKQLIKNTAIGASGMAGAAIGQAAIPVPVVGAVIGGAVGGIASKAILDQFIEDDAKEMFRILKEEFIDQTMLANLSEEEFEKITELTVGNKKASKMLQKMYQSKDFRNYARDSIMIPAILSVTKERNRITQRDYNQAFLEMATSEI